MVPGLHDRRSTVMATVSALVSGLDAELRRLGYQDSTLVWYRGCWRRLARFFAARGIEELALEAAYTDIVTDDLPEWNQDPGLLNWLANL